MTESKLETFKQPFGNASTKHLATLVAGKMVQVDWYKRDRYGRIVGKVLLPVVFHTSADQIDVGLAQVKAGYAWWFRRYQDEQSAKDRRRYAEAKEQARRGRLGLWRENNPVPPWEWR